ncbi:MAG: hypothetical protein PHT33_11365, partial [bacterium]|nr:hypothetical protein [bacterium]
MLKNIRFCLGIVIGICALASAAFAAETLGYRTAVTTVPLGSASVRVDGVVDEQEYADASALTGFLNVCPLGPKMQEENPEHYMVFNPSEAWIKVAGDKLIVAFRFHRLYGDPLVANCDPKKRDANATKDDCVEIFIKNDTSGKTADHYFLVANSTGAIFDGRYNDNTRHWDAVWNGSWEYKTNITDNYWEGEIAIPVKELGSVPKAGDAWRFAVNRYEPGRMRTGWNPCAGYFFNEKYYGNILFTDALAVRVKSIGIMPGYKAGAVISLVNNGKTTHNIKAALKVYPEKSGSVTSVKLPDLSSAMAFEGQQIPLDKAAGKEMNEEISLSPGAARDVAVWMPARPGGTYFVDCLIEEGKVQLAAKSVPVTYKERKALEISIDKYFLNSSMFRVTVKGFSLRPFAGSDLKVILRKGDQTVIERTARIEGADNKAFEIPVKEIKPDDYQLVCEVRDAGGAVKADMRQAFRVPAVPQWRAQPAGIIPEGAVPPPWTSIEIKGRIVRVWGREYHFGNGAFPVRVVTQGKG